jgi:hypothetical protein
MIDINQFARSLILCLTLLVGCGKTGDPLPAQVQLPPTIDDLQVQRLGPNARVLFRVPVGSQWIEIHRQCDPRTALDRIQLIVRLAPDELIESDRVEHFQYQDSGVPAGAQSCRYALRFVDNRGQNSDFSNFALLPPP